MNLPETKEIDEKSNKPCESTKKLIRVEMPKEGPRGHKIITVEGNVTYGTIKQISIDKVNKRSSQTMQLDVSDYVCYQNQVGELNDDNIFKDILSGSPTAKMDSIRLIRRSQVGREGSIDIHKKLAVLTDVNIENLDMKDSSGSIPLIRAATEGNLDLLETLIEVKATLDITDEDNKTALIRAAENGYLAAVKVLLFAKAEVNIPHAKKQLPDGANVIINISGQRKSGVIVGEKNNNLYPVKLTGRNSFTMYHLKNLLPTYACTALLEASSRGYVGVTKILLNAKAEIDLKNFKKETGLILASINGFEELSKMLIDNKADINSKDSHGKTALTHAAERGYEKIVKMLIEAKANIKDTDTNKMTSLHLAVWEGKKKCVKLLLMAKANIYAKDLDGDTPYRFAVWRKHIEIAKLLKATS